MAKCLTTDDEVTKERKTTKRGKKAVYKAKNQTSLSPTSKSKKTCQVLEILATTFQFVFLYSEFTMSDMKKPSCPPMQPIVGLLRADVISVTLKFGFQQHQLEYSINDASIERLYGDAEKWLCKIANNTKNGQLVGCYTIYLFRISLPEFTMVPIVQPSDIEQNSFIEVVLIPIEVNQTPHSLYRCQLNVPTNCSKCSRFISGLYKQGFRCRKCRMTYHRDCAPFLLDDCSAHMSGKVTPTRNTNFTLSPLTFVNPFVTDPASALDRPTTPRTTIVPIYSTSISTVKGNAPVIAYNTIIDKGIFPACMRGAPFYRRYLFRLTNNTLSMATNLSASNVALTQLPQSSDIDTIFSLADIAELVLTHFNEDRDDVFEIHLRNKTVISVGKKTDSDDLQMETATFYAQIRELRETLINETSSPPSPPQSTASPVHEATIASVPNTTVGNLKPLVGKKSLFKKSLCEKDNGNKDLHELYAFTGEKIGEGM
jgi:hypothetical protein